MKEISTKEKEFKDLVHIIRGQQVLLDSDLAQLYGYEVKNFNRQVNNNIKRFPEDFMFQLTKKELDDLWCKNCTANIKKMSRSNPYAFTEQGIYMLSAILKGELAIRQSIYIIREFKIMRHYLVENQLLLNHVDLLELSTTVMQNKKDIHTIENRIETLATKDDFNKIMDNFIDETKIKEKVFMNGQVFDAIKTYIDIYKQANKSIYIIDDYININTLGLLKNKRRNIKVIIFTKNKSKDKLTEIEVTNFNKQYPSLLLKYTDKVHDRFIIIDYGTNKEEFYLCGTSSKDAGNKICAITRLNEKDSMHLVIDKLLKSSDYIF